LNAWDKISLREDWTTLQEQMGMDENIALFQGVVHDQICLSARLAFSLTSTSFQTHFALHNFSKSAAMKSTEASNVAW
jgi:hypothetical protein